MTWKASTSKKPTSQPSKRLPASHMQLPCPQGGGKGGVAPSQGFPSAGLRPDPPLRSGREDGGYSALMFAALMMSDQVWISWTR